jgi:hypothetical protein
MRVGEYTHTHTHTDTNIQTYIHTYTHTQEVSKQREMTLKRMTNQRCEDTRTPKCRQTHTHTNGTHNVTNIVMEGAGATTTNKQANKQTKLKHGTRDPGKQQPPAGPTYSFRNSHTDNRIASGPGQNSEPKNSDPGHTPD